MRTVTPSLAGVAGVAVAAVVAGFGGPGPGGAAPTTSTTVTTAAPTTSIPPATTAPTTTSTGAATSATAVPSTAAVTLPEPESRADDPVGALAPSIGADPAVLDPDEQATTIAELLAAPTNAVAVDGEVGTICAVVPVAAPLAAALRWERNGDLVREADEAVRQPPGFGDCLATDGDALDPGTYQFVVVGPTGATSAAPTLVIGAAAVSTRFVNNGTEPLCLILASPRRADRYEAYSLPSPLLPGEVIGIPLAAVEQEVEVFECPTSGDLGDARSAREFRFTPVAGTDVMLLADDPPVDSTTPPVTTA